MKVGVLVIFEEVVDLGLRRHLHCHLLELLLLLELRIAKHIHLRLWMLHHNIKWRPYCRNLIIFQAHVTELQGKLSKPILNLRFQPTNLDTLRLDRLLLFVDKSNSTLEFALFLSAEFV